MSAKRSMSRALTREESYQDGHLTRTAFISIAILTFITFVGNFTQLQLSAALPTIVSDFGISVTTGQWLTSIFQLVMGVMVPLTAYLTRRFSTREIVLVSMVVFTIGSLFAWLLGNFVEVGEKEKIYSNPMHPYTQALLSAVPVPDPTAKRERILLEGSIPSAHKPPTGCKFHTRCPKCMECCKTQAPERYEVDDGHYVYCHLYDKERREQQK